jgi:hypothetical protein
VVVEAAAHRIVERAQRADRVEAGLVHPVTLSTKGVDKCGRRADDRHVNDCCF